MKKLLLPALALLVLFSCKKNDHLLDINKDILYTNNVDVPKTANPGVPFPAEGLVVPFPKFTVFTNSASFFNDNNATSSQLISAKGKTLNLVSLLPANGYLDYVDSLTLYVSADNLPEVLLAHKYGVTPKQKSIDLSFENVELKEYFLKDSMYFRAVAHFINYPDSNSKITVNTALNVTYNPSK